MLWYSQSILTGNVKLIKTNIMQEHIDTAEVICGDIDFLSIKAVSDSISAQNLFRFQKKRAGATCRIIDFIDFRLTHRSKSSQQLGNISGSKKLAAGFSGTGCVHGHQIFISIAKGINIMLLHIPKIHIRYAMQKFCKTFISLCNSRAELVAVHIKIIKQSGKAAFGR